MADYFEQKNIEFYDFLNRNFGINKACNWSDIAQSITKAKISATYKFFSKLFPRNIDYSLELKPTNTKFRSLHHNNLNPNRIINEVVRYSLYSEEIYVFHPLQNPSITNQNLNPIKASQYWLQNFMDSLYFYIVLQKWVRAGIVKLIVNPYEYDFKLRDKMDSATKIRIKKLLDNSEYDEMIRDEAMENMAGGLVNHSRNMSELEIRKMLLGLRNPVFTVEEATTFAEIIFKKQKEKNPLYNNLRVPLGDKGIFVQRGGGNLESIQYIAELINGSIYTTSKINWLQLQNLDKIDNWTKISHLYSKIELPFLDNVDTSFALSLREEDRLCGVRNSLKSIYGSISSTSAKEIDDRTLYELNGKFIEELKKADAEWSYIKKEAQSKRAYWAMTSVAVPVVFNQVSLLPMMILSSAWLTSNIYNEKLKKDKFRQTNSLSVFIDLENKTPNFFSMLKNCIF